MVPTWKSTNILALFEIIDADRAATVPLLATAGLVSCGPKRLHDLPCSIVPPSSSNQPETNKSQQDYTPADNDEPRNWEEVEIQAPVRIPLRLRRLMESQAPLLRLYIHAWNCDYMYYTLDNTIVEKERFWSRGFLLRIVKSIDRISVLWRTLDIMRKRGYEVEVSSLFASSATHFAKMFVSRFGTHKV
jgi:hypothetical protein